MRKRGIDYWEILKNARGSGAITSNFVVEIMDRAELREFVEKLYVNIALYTTFCDYKYVSSI